MKKKAKVPDSFGRVIYKGTQHTLLTPWFPYLLVCILVIGYLSIYTPYIVDTSESLMYRIQPSADRAYTYGERHFNDTNPQAYNIARAAYFFEQAQQYDTTLPYVHHQLARIAFLRGDFATALAEINVQIQQQGDSTPESYYVRGLIEGFQGDYIDAEHDYAYFLQFDPYNWAGINDYVWVLLKDNKPREAVDLLAPVLPYFTHNAWLLNSDAIALSEIGDATSAKERIDTAVQALQSLSTNDWSHAYPGNDPRIASEGLDAFRAAVLSNMHRLHTGASAHAVE